MNMNMISIGLFALILVASVYLGAYTYVDYHERAHAQVLYLAGYENVYYTATPYGGEITSYEETEYSDAEFSNNYNALVEIYGYHLQGFITNLWLMLMSSMAFVILMMRLRYGR